MPRPVTDYKPLPDPKHSFFFAVDIVKGQARPIFSMRGGYPRAVKPAANLEAEKTIQRAFKTETITQNVRGLFPIEKQFPVSVLIRCAHPIAPSKPKHIIAEPWVSKPDIDNLAKMVLDALNGYAWTDDSQITALTVEKLERNREQKDMTTVLIKWETPWKQPPMP